ncbi:MAG TPA: methionyl-tRNA formyltransferase-like protein [Verrucomicrobiae bacterium]|nr:methionyl-tRNA formyltransferase-like protein [Verrucomicrobiae bacterium]HTZ73595.1 hypothetical protein [Candidatus Aquilonibacter sp.]
MERELQMFERMLADASACIGPEYFQLPVADGDAVYRERVYCYELYHQLRCLWDGFPFSLAGEIDKGGHPHFQDGPYARAKPDLLVHVPGSMDGNLACIEVKPSGRPVAEFAADLRKLTWFCRRANYYRGIFLVYGGGPANELGLRENLVRAIKGDVEIDMRRISVLSHADIGRPLAPI